MKENPISRRVFIRGAAALGAAGLVGCGSEPKKPESIPTTANIIPTAIPVPTEAPKPITPEQYAAFSYGDKLNLIERRGMNPSAYPELTDFKPEREIVLAVSHLYHEVAPLTITPDEMAAKVEVLGKNDYLNALETVYEKPLSASERDEEFLRRVEVVSNDNKRILLSKDAIKLYGDKLKKTEPGTVNSYSGKDLEVILHESILFHAITHANNTQGDTEFPTINLVFPRSTDTFNFSVLNDYSYEGVSQATKEKRKMTGGNEAMTEYIGRHVASVSKRPYISLSPEYTRGANMISYINESVGISKTEFLRYNTELPVEDLFKKWGSLINPNNPDVEAANMAFFAIALSLQGVINYNDAARGINTDLGLTKPIPTN